MLIECLEAKRLRSLVIEAHCIQYMNVLCVQATQRRSGDAPHQWACISCKNKRVIGISDAYKTSIEDTLIKSKKISLPGRRALLKSDVECELVL